MFSCSKFQFVGNKEFSQISRVHFAMGNSLWSKPEERNQLADLKQTDQSTVSEESQRPENSNVSINVETNKF